MTEESGLRIRANVKELASGKWQRDLTVEVIGTDEVISAQNPNDLANIVSKPLAVKLWELIQQIEDEGKKHNRTFADNGIGEKADHE